MTISVIELKEKEKMLACHSLLQQLQPDLTIKEMDACLDVMLPMGYRFFGAFDNGKMVGCTGVWTGAKFYSGKYMEIDNFVIDTDHRSSGVGKFLTDFVIALAKKEECKVVMLDAYLVNESAHKFYQREGFEKKGYHFIKFL